MTAYRKVYTGLKACAGGFKGGVLVHDMFSAFCLGESNTRRPSQQDRDCKLLKDKAGESQGGDEGGHDGSEVIAKNRYSRRACS